MALCAFSVSSDHVTVPKRDSLDPSDLVLCILGLLYFGLNVLSVSENTRELLSAQVRDKLSCMSFTDFFLCLRFCNSRSVLYLTPSYIGRVECQRGRFEGKGDLGRVPQTFGEVDNLARSVRSQMEVREK